MKTDCQNLSKFCQKFTTSLAASPFMALRIICGDGNEVLISKSLFDGTSLFKNDISSANSYQLRCKASLKTMNLLLTRAYDSSAQVVITEDNFAELQSLSEELGFSGLDKELRAFGVSASEFSLKRQILTLEERVNDLYRQNKAILKLFTAQQERMEKRVNALEKLVGDTRRANDELQKSTAHEVQSLKKQLGDVSRDNQNRTLAASREMNLTLEKCSKRIDALARDVALLKENEKQQQKQIQVQQALTVRKQFVCTQSSQLNGIINYLTRMYGGNVHDKEVVNITASSIYNSHHPKNAADLGIDTYYKSQDAPKQWICYEFKAKGMGVIPTSYSVRSGCDTPGGWHLKCWVLEVSNDGTSWRTIDRRDNNDDLNDSHVTRSFKVSKKIDEAFRFVRLKQTGMNQAGNYHIDITSFEIFGTLVRYPA